MKSPRKIWRAIKIVLSDREAKREIEGARAIRKEVNKKIDKMIADLNGCSDSWFLSVRDPLDKCVPKDGDLK